MRNITLGGHFRSEAARKFIVSQDAGTSIVVGQIIGDVLEVKAKQGKLPNGEIVENLVLIGEFVATNFEAQRKVELAQKEAAAQGYGPGQVDEKGQLLYPEDYQPMEATQAYLPRYFAEQVAANLKRFPRGMLFAVDVSMVATGKTVPYAWEVTSQVKKAANSRLAQMADHLRKSGTLKIDMSKIVGTHNDDEVPGGGGLPSAQAAQIGHDAPDAPDAPAAEQEERLDRNGEPVATEEANGPPVAQPAKAGKGRK